MQPVGDEGAWELSVLFADDIALVVDADASEKLKLVTEFGSV